MYKSKKRTRKTKGGCGCGTGTGIFKGGKSLNMPVKTSLYVGGKTRKRKIRRSKGGSLSNFFADYMNPSTYQPGISNYYGTNAGKV